MVEVLLELGVKVDESLQWEGKLNHLTVSEREIGEYEKSWNWNGDSALVAAAREGHLDVVTFLLKHGASKNHKSCYYFDEYDTPYDAAVRKDQFKVANFIKAFES
jgi:hypothetical protein